MQRKNRTTSLPNLTSSSPQHKAQNSFALQLTTFTHTLWSTFENITSILNDVNSKLRGIQLDLAQQKEDIHHLQQNLSQEDQVENHNNVFNGIEKEDNASENSSINYYQQQSNSHPTPQPASQPQVPGRLSPIRFVSTVEAPPQRPPPPRPSQANSHSRTRQLTVTPIKHFCTKMPSCIHCRRVRNYIDRHGSTQCNLCYELSHPANLCHHFPTLASRRERATNMHLCTLCLKIHTGTCSTAPCPRCHDSHNSALCPFLVG